MKNEECPEARQGGRGGVVVGVSPKSKVRSRGAEWGGAGGRESCSEPLNQGLRTVKKVPLICSLLGLRAA